MKSFLWFTLVVGLCISSSCGKEKLKIDLPENFQVDFIKSFARVMKNDYPNCHINPQEMFGKVGQEFLKRAGAAGGMGIHLEDENGRSKRSVEGILAKLKAPFGGLGKRSIDENNAEASQRTKRSLDPLTKLTTKLAGLKAPLGLGKRSTGEEDDGERMKRSLDPITKLTTKLASLKAPLGIGKRSTGEEDDGERTKRTIKPHNKLLGLKNILGKRSIDEDSEMSQRTKRSLQTLKSKLGLTGKLGKRSVDDVWTPEDEYLAQKFNVGRVRVTDEGTFPFLDVSEGARSSDGNRQEFRKSQAVPSLSQAVPTKLKSKIELGRNKADDNVWTPEDEALAKKFNVGRVRVTAQDSIPSHDGAKPSDGYMQTLQRAQDQETLPRSQETLRRSQGLVTKLKSESALGKKSLDNVWTPADEALAKKFNVGRVRVAAQDAIPSHDGARPSDGYMQTLQRAQDQETLPRSQDQEVHRSSQGLASKLKSEIGLRKKSVDNVWTPEDEEIAKNFNVDRIRYSHVVSEGAGPSQGNLQGFKNSQSVFKRKIGLGSQPAQTETEQNRERRSAFEMLMENIDEVKVKRSADLNQGNAKRKRRSLMDLLSDPGRAGNVEF